MTRITESRTTRGIWLSLLALALAITCCSFWFVHHRYDPMADRDGSEDMIAVRAELVFTLALAAVLSLTALWPLPFEKKKFVLGVRVGGAVAVAPLVAWINGYIAWLGEGPHDAEWYNAMARANHWITETLILPQWALSKLGVQLDYGASHVPRWVYVRSHLAVVATYWLLGFLATVGLAALIAGLRRRSEKQPRAQ